MTQVNTAVHNEPWNKGKLVGQKAPLKLKDIWAIRVRLQLAMRTRELALFDLGIDSKLRACDLVKLRVRDIAHGQQVAARAFVLQQKTKRPVQFEITGLPARLLPLGFSRRTYSPKISFSRAGFTSRHTFQLVNTHVLSISGSTKLDWIFPRTARIQ